MREGGKVKIRVSILLSIFITSATSLANLYAQKVSISTNALSYVNLLTINAEVGYSLERNWSVFASGKYNPFPGENGNTGGSISTTTKSSEFSSNIDPNTSNDFVNKQATSISWRKILALAYIFRLFLRSKTPIFHV